MQTNNKLLAVILGGLGLAGAAVGIYAAINPTGIAAFFNGFDENQLGTALGIGIPAFFILIFGLAFGPFVKQAIKNSKKKKHLMMVGQKADAKILSIRDTGLTVNNAPYIEVVVELKGQQATFTTLVSRVGIPQPGNTIQVLYDPADPTQVMPA